MIYAELRTEEFPHYKYDLFNPPPAYTSRTGTWKLTDEKPQRWKFDEDVEPSIPMTIPMPALVPTTAMPSKRHKRQMDQYSGRYRSTEDEKVICRVEN